ncbi:MAG: hypothetical protein ACYDAG_12955 [Chloroflexota bacterium]
MANANWPSDMVDELRIYELLGYKFREPAVIGDEAYRRIVGLEQAIGQAQQVGRIKRFAAKDPSTGVVVGRGYKRADVQRIMNNGG